MDIYWLISVHKKITNVFVMLYSYVSLTHHILKPNVKISRLLEKNGNAQVLKTYLSFAFRKQKVLSELQPNLLSFFFDCMMVSSPFKSDLSRLVADEDDGNLDFTVSYQPFNVNY